MSTFAGRTVLMSGGSRGIGLEIACRLAAEGANIALLAKTDVADPRLPGTVHTAAAAIEEAGGQALPLVGDVRDATTVQAAVARTVERFGGIDICLNNASAVTLAPMRDLPAKRFDLMLDVNIGGTQTLTACCLPHLRRSDCAHVLTLSPPLNPDPRWLRGQSAYTLSKYGMTMLTLGVAADEPGIAANCLWPRTSIATAAVQNVLGGAQAISRSRRPAIVADAAYEVLRRAPAERTGQTLIDDEVLAEAGITDLSSYGPPDHELLLDFFIDALPSGTRPPNQP